MHSSHDPRPLAHQVNRDSYSLKSDTLIHLLADRIQDRDEVLLLMDMTNEAHPVTASEIMRHARIAAGDLMDRGLARGDRVVLMIPTSREFLYVYFGVLLAGGIAVPISQPAGPGHQAKHLTHVAHITRDCKAKFFITFDRMEMIIGASEEMTIETRFVFCDDIFRNAADHLSDEALPGIGTDDVAFIQYTSGTTSLPKGVVLTHGNILHNIHAIGVAGAMSGKDTSISWLPLYHDMGLTGALLTAIYWRIRLILMRPEAFIFNPHWWLQNIGRFKASISVAPNFGYHYCTTRISEKDCEGLDLSSWRLALNGAEPIDRMTLDRFYDKFERYGLRPRLFMPVYGMAENSLAATFPALDQPTVTRRFDRRQLQEDNLAIDTVSEEPTGFIDLVSVGYPILGQEVKIADAHGHTLHEREVGEILIKSPSLTRGYYQNPGATRKAIRNGWLHTGDLGFILEGRLFISGRIKEMIIKRGKNIYPYDVERTAATVDGVRLGASVAFAVENKDTGTEDLVLVCESLISDPQGIAELRKEIEIRILSCLGFRPDRVEILPKGTIPKTTSGKIQRIECKSRFLAGTLMPGLAGHEDKWTNHSAPAFSR